MAKGPSETPLTIALSIQVRSTLMSYLYDMATDKDLPDTHYVIRYRRATNAKWESMSYKYSDYQTVRSGALQYVNILNHLPTFELYVFQVRDGVHSVKDHYSPSST
jgi:hypothetical protein